MKHFKLGDKCIVTKDYYKGLHVEVISYYSLNKVHVKNLTRNYTFFIPEEILELETIYNSPLYKALS